MFSEIKKMVNGRVLPLLGKNEEGEVLILSQGKDDNGEYYQAEVAQHNDWCRINRYYADGTITETYKK